MKESPLLVSELYNPSANKEISLSQDYGEVASKRPSSEKEPPSFARVQEMWTGPYPSTEREEATVRKGLSQIWSRYFVKSKKSSLKF